MLADFAKKQKVAPKAKTDATEGAATAPKSGSLSWMVRGDENIRKMVDSQRANASRKYPPELWFRSGEERNIRFRRSEPLCCLMVYNLKIGGRFIKVTAPGSGERDLFREAGLRPSFRAIYEVVDIDGYEKDGKKHTMLPRFLSANIRLHEQLEAIRKKKGTLSKFNICLQKTGKGVNTTFAIIPDDPAPLPGLERVQSIANDLAKYYSPPSLDEQRGLLGQHETEEPSSE